MIFTARQLEDLHRSSGHVTLPVGARLTPMASDWLKRRGVAAVFQNESAVAPVSTSSAPAPAGTILWWCDGPCGAAKAALAAEARERNIQPLQVNAEPKFLVAAVKQLAAEIKSDRAVAGILLVQAGAAAVVFANRCPSLRAILGTCREAVQQGIDLVAANVLLIETPYQTMQQTRNLIAQFVRTRRTPSDDVKRQLQELASCG
jgi:hypothetical protein